MAAKNSAHEIMPSLFIGHRARQRAGQAKRREGVSKRRYTRSLCGPAGGWGRAYDTRCLGAFAPMLLVSYRPLAPVHVSRAPISPAQPLERFLARAAEQPHILATASHSEESK